MTDSNNEQNIIIAWTCASVTMLMIVFIMTYVACASQHETDVIRREEIERINYSLREVYIDVDDDSGDEWSVRENTRSNTPTL